MSDTALYREITRILKRLDIHHVETTHAPVFTTQAAELTSGHDPASGTKSLVLSLPKDRLAVVTVCGDDRVSFDDVKRLVMVRKVSMARNDAVLDRLGTEPGGVAPFGYFPDVPLIVSRRLYRQAKVYFNAGRNDVTIQVTGPEFEDIMRDCGALHLP